LLLYYKMSYNTEITYSNTKYNYTNIQTTNQIYIFELILITINNEKHLFRCIKKNNQGKIDIDEILFNTVNKFKLTVLNINSPDKPLILKKIIDHSINSNIYLTDEIYLEINKTSNNFIEFNYNIIQ
jgi:hypothetical protein